MKNDGFVCVTLVGGLTEAVGGASMSLVMRPIPSHFALPWPGDGATS